MEEHVKRVKLISILAAAALGAIGIMGAGSASAAYTVLCSEPEQSVCSAGAVQPSGSTITTFMSQPSESTTFYFKVKDNQEGTDLIKCRDNQITFKSLAQKKDPLPAELIGSVDPTECRTQSLSEQNACTSASITASSGQTSLVATGQGGGYARIGGLKLSFTCKYKYLGLSWSETCQYAASAPVDMTIEGGGIPYRSAILSAPVTKTAGSAWCGYENHPLSLFILNLVDLKDNYISASL
ncbi:MAG TPA: hypothetical protein VNC16_01370 [Solirubrobacterales bacterium]|jgi:hypothetical protein|nr:hypothetical protein [Solirubrobacterales bacterium]